MRSRFLIENRPVLPEKTNVTLAGIDELKKALLKCKIEWNNTVVEP